MIYQTHGVSKMGILSMLEILMVKPFPIPLCTIYSHLYEVQLCPNFLYVLHSGMGKGLTIKISNMDKIPIFYILGVIGFMPYAQFFPLP